MRTTKDVGWDEVLLHWSFQWRDLLRRLDIDVSLAPEWVDSAARARNCQEKLRALLAIENGRLVGAIPYYSSTERTAGFVVRVLNLGGNFCSYHQELPVERDHANLLDQLACAVNGWEILRVRGVPKDGPTDRALAAFARMRSARLSRIAADASPYIPIDRDWEQFLSSKSHNFRYNLRRKCRALNKAGFVEYKHYRTFEQVDEFFSHMLSVEAHSWKVSEGMAVLENSIEKRYYNQLLPWLAREGIMSAHVLLLDGRAIAYSLGYIWNGRYGQLKTSFDDKFRTLSAGWVLTAHLIQSQFVLKNREFDFLGDKMRHKMEWTPQIRMHDDIEVFVNARRINLVWQLRRILRSIR